jgi:hypothetical protein
MVLLSLGFVLHREDSSPQNKQNFIFRFVLKDIYTTFAKLVKEHV